MRPPSNASRRLLLLLACTAVALGSGHDADMSDASGRKLLGATASGSKPGPFTEWVVAECKTRCPNLFLASWGFQCALGLDYCCQRANSLCTPVKPYKSEPKPSSWTGKNNTGGVEPACPAPPQPLPPVAKCNDSGTWMNASATQFWSYPPCCDQPAADQTECAVYSGCVWKGQFAATGTKSKSYVQANNIVAFFQPPNGQNQKDFDKKFANKKLKIRNPYTCKMMTVTILDTCDDNDCPDPSGKGPGCCTAHANENGGRLVDLEYFTSLRFWGYPIGVDEVRRLEFQFL